MSVSNSPPQSKIFLSEEFDAHTIQHVERELFVDSASFQRVKLSACCTNRSMIKIGSEPDCENELPIQGMLDGSGQERSGSCEGAGEKCPADERHRDGHPVLKSQMHESERDCTGQNGRSIPAEKRAIPVEEKGPINHLLWPNAHQRIEQHDHPPEPRPSSWKHQKIIWLNYRNGHCHHRCAEYESQKDGANHLARPRPIP